MTLHLLVPICVFVRAPVGPDAVVFLLLISLPFSLSLIACIARNTLVVFLKLKKHHEYEHTKEFFSKVLTLHQAYWVNQNANTRWKYCPFYLELMNGCSLLLHLTQCIFNLVTKKCSLNDSVE